MIYSDWLAKSEPREALLRHTERCVRVALRVIELLPSCDREFAKEYLLAAAVHDLGKAASGFQDVLAGRAKDWMGRRHESLSAVIAGMFPESSEAVIMSVLFHHKTLPSNGITDEKGTMCNEHLPPPFETSPAWRKMARQIEESIPEMPEFWAALCALVPEAGLPLWPSTKADWKDSLADKGFDPKWASRDGQLEIPPERRQHAAKLRGLLRTADHLASAGEIPPDQIVWPEVQLTGIADLRGFQVRAGEANGGMLMRAPTGSGKTEASILWLKRNQARNTRTFYVLPHTASINAMHRRLESLFPGKVGVLHGRAAHYLNKRLNEDLSSATVEQRRRSQHDAISMKQLAKEMYYPMRVCTPHQLIRYFLRGPGWEQMLSEFEGACFIFDEIHAYDPKTLGLILGGMRMIACMNTRIAFMSATFPRFLAKLIEEYLGIHNLIVPDSGNGGDRTVLERKRHRVIIRDAAITDIWDEIGRKLDAGTVLIVVNHVASAQHVYSEAKSRFGLMPDDIELLHGAFNGKDRTEIENRILSDNPPRLLVATQAAEVSLDINYDCGYLEAAPIDALAQRMGRVNRAGRAVHPAEINIMTRQLSPHQLYNKSIVESTISALSSASPVLSETELVELADTVYGDGYSPLQMEAFEEAFYHQDYRNFERSLLAGAHQPWVEQIIEKADQSVDVLPTALCGRYDELIADGLWLEASSLLVPVKVSRLASCRGTLITSRDPWQTTLPYDSKTGLGFKAMNNIDDQFI